MNDDPGRLGLLYQLGAAFAAQMNLDELCRLVVSRCRDVFDAEGASILLLAAESGELHFPYAAGEDPAVAAELLGLRFAADRGIAGAVLRGNRALRIDDVTADPRFYGGIDRSTGMRTRNLLCAPLRGQQGTVGVIEVLNRRTGDFTDDDLAFLDALGGSVAVAIENARLYAELRAKMAALEEALRERTELIALRRELEIASGIQQSILPRTFPPFPGRRDFDIFATMIPAREVGGDFYDFFLIDEARVGVVIGDVSGKGIPAAFFMAVGRTLLRAAALGGSTPADCLRQVNALLVADNDAEMFVSVFYGILDTRRGALAYSIGGHNPPLLLRAGGRVEELPATGGAVLGVLEDAAYRAGHATVGRGDALFLYTDGITEAMDAEGREFSEDRLRAVLAKSGGGSPEDIIRAVVAEVNRHAGGMPQSDDVTALAVRYLGA
jgi:serine phosphatase RsbU (regulator of sigma subunit)